VIEVARFVISGDLRLVSSRPSGGLPAPSMGEGNRAWNHVCPLFFRFLDLSSRPKASYRGCFHPKAQSFNPVMPSFSPGARESATSFAFYFLYVPILRRLCFRAIN